MKFFAAIFLLIIANISIGSETVMDEEMATEILKKINQGYNVTEISQTDVSGVNEALINGREIVYMTEDGQYIFTGKLIAISSDKITDVTEGRMNTVRQGILSDVNRNTLITFSSNQDNGPQVYVFTDISCAYCIKFHEHIEDMTNSGITVNYLAFPRAGLGTSVSSLMNKVWCAEDRLTALTEAKEKGTVSQPSIPCRSPLQEHMELARNLGVNGTPAIYDERGRRLGGYLDTEQLLKALE